MIFLKRFLFFFALKFFFLMLSTIRTHPCQLLLAKVRSYVTSKELIFIEKAKDD